MANTAINWMKLNKLVVNPAFAALVNADDVSTTQSSATGEMVRARLFDISFEDQDKVKLFLDALGVELRDGKGVLEQYTKSFFGRDGKGAVLNLVIGIGDKVPPVNEALDNALSHAGVFKEIGEKLAEQERDWKVEKDKPVSVRFGMGNVDRIQAALKEQGIAGDVQSSAPLAPVDINITDGASLKKLKQCLDKISKIQSAMDLPD